MSPEPKATHQWTDYKDKFPIWCPGCGDFGVLGAMQRAAAELDLDPDNTVLVTGIGCSGLITSSFRTYGFHGVHGRALPAATGIKLANPGLTVLVAGGDGDGYGIGAGHLVHAARRNLDVTYIVMDNQTYGLTKGQVSPTTATGYVTKTTPEGNPEHPVQPLALALVCGATYIASGFSTDQKRLAPLIRGAIEHQGFSLINIQSPCVTYNKVNDHKWYQEHLVAVEDEGHDPTRFEAAVKMVTRTDGMIPHGLVYKAKRPTLESLVGHARAPAREDLGATLRARKQELAGLAAEFA